VRHLVTGGAGFIGSHLTDALVARGDEVLVLDDLSTGRRANVEHLLSGGRVELVEGSTLDRDLVEDCMASVDTCFHLASAVGVGLILAKPVKSLLSTVRGTDTVLSAAAARRRPFIFTSTSEVYGKNPGPWLREDADRLLGSPSKARWLYANAKTFGESLALGYFRDERVPAVVARLFNTVGPRQSADHGMVLPRFVRQALAGEDLTVYGDGSQVRCFCHVSDAVDALLRLAGESAAAGNAYNVGTSEEISVGELARRVVERTGSASGIRLVPYEQVYTDGFEEPLRGKPDTTALRELTGWRPLRDLDAAIAEVVAEGRAEARPAAYVAH